MKESIYQTDIKEAGNFLYQLISSQVGQDKLSWLNKKLHLISTEGPGRTFYLAFGATPRFLGKDTLNISDQDLMNANIIRNGFNPLYWTIDQVARVLLIISLPHSDRSVFMATIEQVFDTAEMNEQVALYKGLPLLPYPEGFIKRAEEGIRTNIRDIFDAVALDNPFPHDYLSENAWNQMVLKALFTERPLYRIYGLDNRTNPRLSRILSDYAHERWAAHREVSPELWRAVGSHVDEIILEDIKELFNDTDPIQHEAAALLCANSNSDEAKKLLETKTGLKNQIEDKTLTWETVSRKCWQGG